MRLCSRNWKMLAVGEEERMQVGIEGLIALSGRGAILKMLFRLETKMDDMINATNYINPRSTTTEQLCGLEYLLDASKTTILAFGNQRQCRKDTAEAIMSAFGVEDCHANGGEELGSEQYLLAFLRKATQKIGAAFYDSEFGENL